MNTKQIGKGSKKRTNCDRAWTWTLIGEYNELQLFCKEAKILTFLSKPVTSAKAVFSAHPTYKKFFYFKESGTEGTLVCKNPVSELSVEKLIYPRDIAVKVKGVGEARAIETPATTFADPLRDKSDLNLKVEDKLLMAWFENYYLNLCTQQNYHHYVLDKAMKNTLLRPLKKLKVEVLEKIENVVEQTKKLEEIILNNYSVSLSLQNIISKKS